MQKIDITQFEDKELTAFLCLIRDNYGLADEANFFLEQSGVSSISVAIANQRDAVSHFVSFLNNPGKEKLEYRLHQVSAAEEHLRRAVIEPYQLAVDLKKRELLDDFEEYLKLPPSEHVLPVESVYKVLQESSDLTIIGRSAKKANSWNDEWEKGVRAYIQAFNLLTKTISSIQPIVYRCNEASKKSKSKKKLFTTNAIYLLVGCIIGLFLSATLL